jgi:hypothetical protein
VTAADHGAVLACQVTARNISASALATSPATAAIVLGPPRNRTPPTMTLLDIFGEAVRCVPPGEVRARGRLRCNPGDWVDARGVGYQWLRDGGPIPGATDQMYRP